MTELTKDIELLVTQHLPALAANELAAFIEQAKIDKRVLEITKNDLEIAKQEVKELRARSNIVEQAARTAAAQKEENDNRAKELATKAAELDAARNKLVADVAMAELKGVKDTMSQFLRNTTVRSNVTESVGIPVPGATGTGNYAGTPGFVQQAAQNRSTTTEQE